MVMVGGEVPEGAGEVSDNLRPRRSRRHGNGEGTDIRKPLIIPALRPRVYYRHPRVRPDLIEERAYQTSIARVCWQRSTLVVLPTGLGKTVIALMVLVERMDLGKILLLAPTRPLVEQHASFLKGALVGDPAPVISVFTGTVPPKKREEQFAGSDIIVSTPQVIQNDIISGRIHLRDTSLVIFDEAHRGVGDYAYVFIADRYSRDRVRYDMNPGKGDGTGALPWGGTGVVTGRGAGVATGRGAGVATGEGPGTSETVGGMAETDVEGSTVTLTQTPAGMVRGTGTEGAAGSAEMRPGGEGVGNCAARGTGTEGAAGSAERQPGGEGVGNSAARGTGTGGGAGPGTGAVGGLTLGITASPGSNSDRILEVCENLGIRGVEIRSEYDADVYPYVQKVKINWVEVDLPAEVKRIRDLLNELYVEYLKNLQRWGLLNQTTMVSKKMLCRSARRCSELCRCCQSCYCEEVSQ